jgi:parvulin-like peptidyl-prolyl isomerase
MHRSNTTLGFLFLSLLALAACSREQEDVVAQVGKEVLTRSQLEAMMPASVASSAGPEVYQDLARRWIRNQLLAQEARRLDLDVLPEVKDLIRQRTAEVLGEALQQRLLDSVPESDELQLRKYYEGHQQEFLRLEPEVGIRRIKVADQTVASALRPTLTPANFSSEAARLNPDATAEIQTARLWRRGEFPPGVGDQIFAMEPGTISSPIQLPDGWALYLLISKAPAGSVRPFQDVVDLIRVRLAEATRQSRLDELVGRLSRQYEVTLDLKKMPGSDSAARPSSDRN